jgi:hypothetical protein
VTQRPIDLFKLGLQMADNGQRESKEYIEVCSALHTELGLRLWHEDIFDVDVNDEPPAGLDPLRRTHFKHVVNLRRQLILATCSAGANRSN